MLLYYSLPFHHDEDSMQYSTDLEICQLFYGTPLKRQRGGENEKYRLAGIGYLISINIQMHLVNYAISTHF